MTTREQRIVNWLNERGRLDWVSCESVAVSPDGTCFIAAVSASIDEGLTFDDLQRLAAAFGTKLIDMDKTSSGCDTCGYGTSHDITVRNIMQWPEEIALTEDKTDE